MGGGSKHERKANVESTNPVLLSKSGGGGYNLNLFIIATFIVFVFVYLFGVGVCYVAHADLRIHYEALAGLELTIFLLQVLECWDFKQEPSCLVKIDSIHSLGYYVPRS